MTATTYAIGVPLVITVQDDGTVEFEVDLSDVDLEYDADLTYPEDVVKADQAHVSEVLRTFNHTHQFPTQSA